MPDKQANDVIAGELRVEFFGPERLFVALLELGSPLCSPTVRHTSVPVVPLALRYGVKLRQFIGSYAIPPVVPIPPGIADDNSRSESRRMGLKPICVIFESLILAQDERWRRVLGMQVERRSIRKDRNEWQTGA